MESWRVGEMDQSLLTPPEFRQICYSITPDENFMWIKQDLSTIKEDGFKIVLKNSKSKKVDLDCIQKAFQYFGIWRQID